MDLRDLKARIDAARAAMEAPLEPGESRAVMPVTAYLSEDDYTEVWKAVRALRCDHPEVFNYFPEVGLADEVIFALGEREDTPILEELADQLQRGAADQGPWLVSTPLANIELPSAWLPVAEGVALHRAYSTNNPSDGEYNEQAGADMEIFKFLGDHTQATTRLIPGGADANTLDTTRSATLLTVEEGTRPLALSRARSKAWYAISVWSIVHPPSDMALLPDVAINNPQPFLRTPQRSKEFEPGEWISKKRTSVGSIYHWGPYEAPQGSDLALPFEALAIVEKHRSAHALLSASLAIFQAARGSRFLLTERLRHVLVAVETLCERKPGEWLKWERWETVRDRFDAQAPVRARGYTEEEIERAEKRLRDARNIATHGADAVLIDLGYPQGQERMGRGKPLASADLAFAALSADLTVLIAEVQHVLSELLPFMREQQWRDDEFQAQFAR